MRSPRPAISRSRSAAILAASMFVAMAGSGIFSVPADASGQRARVAEGPEDVVAAEPIVIDGHAFAADYVLVQVKTGVRADRLPARALAEAGVESVTSIFVEPPRDVETAARIGLDRWYRCTLKPGADAQAARARLARTRGVERAELDPEGGLAEIPNDPNFFVQYALRNTGQIVNGQTGTAGADIGMTAAWEFTQGDPNLVIAVLDSGVDPHPELAGRILPGLNVPDGNTATADECNHGTHVAGILAASTNNAAGIAGIARTARILPVVVVNGCSGFEVNVAAGLTWAADQGAKLINMSLQFNLGSTPLLQAVQYAHAQGALMVAASGNSNLNPPAFPARWDETLAVGSTDSRDVRAISSNYGPELDLVAPGVNIWSLNAASSGYGYTFKSGTSMATPHVTATAALLWSYRPDLTREQVREYLVSTTRDLGTPGYDIYYGSGRLDAAAALAAVPPFAAEDINQDGEVNAADLSLLLAGWGPCGDCDSCPADIDGDCDVGASDLSLFLAAW
ncbi:MAG: S8 family serine peptidase [Planctomycetaceae bacterium]|nr:S8 family serine peptidase [Planctomycetaceae bacterium]